MTYKHSIFAVMLLVVGSFFSVQAEYRLPEYQSLTLDNGLTLYLMEQHEVPMIDVSVVVKAGALMDGDKPGLASMTVDSMEFGTQKLSREEFEATTDFIGATIGSSGGIEFSTISSSFASKDEATMMTILRDMVINPRFDDEEFANYKKRYSLKLEQEKESPKAVINTWFNRLMFGESGYGSVVQGDLASVASMTNDDIKAFHKTWYRPDNAAVIVVGDFDSNKMLIRLKALFSSWEKPKAKLATIKAKPAAAKSQSNVLLVNKDDALETTFVIGGKGIKRSNEDYVAVSVINTILGGRFTSWLNDELRVNSGLTYGARSRFTSFREAGVFYMTTFTKTASTVDAIDLALSTYERLWEKGIDEATLSSAKAYVKGQFPPNFETSSQLADLLAQMYGFGFDENFINTFEEQVNSLTVERAKDVINAYFPRNNLQFVLVGKASDIKESIKKYGSVKQVDIKSDGYKL